MALLEQSPDGNETVSVAGRVTALRRMGKAAFMDLRDGSGRIQAYFKQESLGVEPYELLQQGVDLGDFLGVTGSLFHTKTGEPTIEAQSYTVLAKALRPPPEKWHGLQDVEVRYRQRYLDLMANAEVREHLRHAVAHHPRDQAVHGRARLPRGRDAGPARQRGRRRRRSRS